MTNKPRLILYELNELPRKLLLSHINSYPNGGLAKIVQTGLLVNTICPNVGELHPWSTWPTFHRGVSNQQHSINYINQDLSTVNSVYPPIWQVLNDNNITTGVFASLQSYPPTSSPHSLFYLPDTFAPDAQAYPDVLSDFQAFNLKLVSTNRASVGSLTTADVLRFLRLISNKAINFTTLYSILTHILTESIRPLYKSRRALFQSTISFDLYMQQLLLSKPDFSTYFTNHLAGMMHRYWRHYFPSDFTGPYPTNPFHADSITKALKIVDSHLLRLRKYCDTYNCDLLVASSMGQAAVDRGQYYPEYKINDFKRFIYSLNLDPACYNLYLSMHPDLIVECCSEASRNSLLDEVMKLTDSLSMNLFRHRYQSDSLRLNLSLLTSKASDAKDIVLFNNKTLHPSSFGLELFSRHQGTAYHIPDGIALAYGHNITTAIASFQAPNTPLLTSDFKSILMSFYGL